MLKQKIIRELVRHPEAPISGQTLADLFSVSRNAVWKAVRTLQAEGYPIQADGKKGYLLNPDTNLLSRELIRSFLPPQTDLVIIACEEMDSTNSEAHRMLAAGRNEAALIVCNRQTHGRGHSSSTFSSPADTGLYMSLILPIQVPIDLYRNIPRASAAAVVQTLRALSDLPITIRNIDELFLSDRKIGGILCEAYSAELETGLLRSLIIGIGIHLAPENYPDNLLNSMLSLGYTISRNRLAALLADSILHIDFTDTENGALASF